MALLNLEPHTNQNHLLAQSYGKWEIRIKKIQNIFKLLYWALTVLNIYWIHVFPGVCFHPDDSVFKVHFFTPNFSPPGAGGCYDTKICQCHGEHVTHHNPPLLYDIFHDPSESHPLTPDTEPRYAEILEQIAKAVERHRSTLTDQQTSDDTHSHTNADVLGVQSQMTWDKIIWRPWLQPCCGTFPFCGCTEDTAHI